MLGRCSHAKAYGYFSPERFTERAGKGAAHELAIDPDHFGRTDELILSTLVHEMVHVWQQVHGTAPRRSYHDRQWATKMKGSGYTLPAQASRAAGKPARRSRIT